MLKRGKFLVAFLAVTVLCAGIGFAAVQDSLKASGGVTVNALDSVFDEDVYFSAAVVDGSSTVTDSTNKVTVATVVDSADSGDTGSNKDAITIAVSDGAFTDVENKLVVKATIMNTNASQAANVVLASKGFTTATGSLDQNGANCFELKVTSDAAGNTAIDETTGITVTSTADVYIILTMNSLPADNFVGTISVELTATPVAPSSGS